MSKSRPIVFYSFLAGKDTWARVCLNGVPIYRSPTVGPDSRSGPANYLLGPGDNELKVELLRVTEPTGDLTCVQDSFVFELYTVNNPDAPEGVVLDRTVLVNARFPKIKDDAREPYRRLPLYHVETFRLDLALDQPLFRTAEPAQFDCQGTPGLRDAVSRIHGCLERADGEGLLAELDFKFECSERALEGVPEQTAGAKKQTWREELLAFRPRSTRPLDFDELHFEARCGGRVAHVTRRDDQLVLDAVCDLDRNRRITTDLTLIQHQGRWRVFA